MDGAQRNENKREIVDSNYDCYFVVKSSPLEMDGRNQDVRVCSVYHILSER